MTVKLTSSGIQYNDGTVQSTTFNYSLDKGRLIRVDTFTSSGTWTKPSDCRKIVVVCVGGGGGGCGHNESGGAGGYSELLLDATGLSTVSVTIGGGGDGRTYHQGCGDGGQTAFGPYNHATGGRGANTDWGHTGGRGGHGGGGNVNVWGGGGRSHGDQGQDRGGESFFGGSQVAGHHGGYYYRHWNEGLNHNPPGTGGNGEWSQHSRGGYGTSGICIVYNYS
jgi:hypothetical protein